MRLGRIAQSAQAGDDWISLCRPAFHLRRSSREAFGGQPLRASGLMSLTAAGSPVISMVAAFRLTDMPVRLASEPSRMWCEWGFGSS